MIAGSYSLMTRGSPKRVIRVASQRMRANTACCATMDGERRTVNDCLKPIPELPDETARRGALVLQTLPIVLIPALVAVVVGVLLRLNGGAEFPSPESAAANGLEPRSPLIPIVVLVIFFSSLIILVRIGRPTLSALTLIGAWTLMTTLASLRNGVSTQWPALLIVPIVVAGLLLDGTASVSLAALATLLIGSIAWLELTGNFVPHDNTPAFVRAFLEANGPILSFGFWVGLIWTVAALTSLLAGSLQRAVKQSHARAAELRELSAELEARVQAQTSELLAQSRETATLEERARLARDIHDTLAQGLTGIVVQLGAAQRALGGATVDAREHIDLAQRMARESLAEARRSVWNLRSPVLERGDLQDALRGLVARPLRPGITGTFEQRGAPWPLPADAESALLRVAQEALVNVAKHSEATAVDVALEYLPDMARLTVRDNGRGFAESVLSQHPMPPGPWGGFGLLGMRERIGALGGALALTSPGGAEVVATVPRVRAGEPSPGQALSAVAEVEA